MSRIGNAIITVAKDVTITKEGDQLVVKGSKGEITLILPQGITMTRDGDTIKIGRLHNDKPSKSLHGYLRAALDNAITGVTKGWTRTLELSGVGYRASVTGVNLVLTIGFSHPVKYQLPAGVKAEVEKQTMITLSGADKQVIGQAAANIRGFKPPEPYKGKGIKYQGEKILRKAGKAGKAGK